VFVCRCGGNISDVVDVDALVAAIQGVAGVVTAKVNTFMCSDPGQALIADEIKSQNLNRVVVASCSPFLHELTFRTAVQRGGLNPFLYEHVNMGGGKDSCKKPTLCRLNPPFARFSAPIQVGRPGIRNSKYCASGSGKRLGLSV
jgi:hypothetical protein